MTITSDGITREITHEEAVPWQPQDLHSLLAGVAPSIEEQLETARKAGYEEGFQQALADGEQRAAQQREEITRLLRYLAQPLASVDETLKQSLLALAAEMARHIVAREFGGDLSFYRNQLTQLSEKLPAQVKVSALRLNPESASLLRELCRAEADSDSPLPEIVADAELSNDVCLACWEDSAVDISLRGRLASIVQSFCGDSGSEALANLPVAGKPDETDKVSEEPAGELDSEKKNTAQSLENTQEETTPPLKSDVLPLDENELMEPAQETTAADRLDEADK